MQTPAAFDPPPLPPAEPDAAECCGEGCTHCVLDVYDAALERYRMALASWQARQSPPPDDRDAAAAANATNLIPESR